MSLDPSHGPRPRRLSFTQHLHRMFNVDLPLNKQCSTHSTANEPSMYMSTNLKGNETRGPSHLTDPGPKRIPCEPLSSAKIESNRTEIRSMLSSEQSTSRKPSLQVTTTSTAKRSPERPQICVSPTWHTGMTQKSERRATRRLEKERQELEARLMRLEQTKERESHNISRNNPRRLIKKQPLGSSSRASSVGAEESRVSRFSAVFSRHSSRSRSRSSSLTEDKHTSRHRSLNRMDVLQSDLPSQEGATVLPITLPERFGAAVSKDLTVKPNVLLPPYIYTDFSAIDVDGRSSPEGVVEDSVAAQEGYTRGRRVHEKKSIVLDQMQSANPQNTSTVLDRMSFTASLKLGKRNGDVKPTHDTSPLLQSQQTVHQEANQPSTANITTSPLKLSSNHEISHHALNATYQEKSTVIHPEISNNQTFGRGIPRRSHKRFASSPLAGSPTINPDIDTTPSAKAASFSNKSKRLASSGQRITHPVIGPRSSIESSRAGKKPWGFSRKHRLAADLRKPQHPPGQKNEIYGEPSYFNASYSPASQPVAIQDVGKSIQTQLKDKDPPCLGTEKDGCSEDISSLVEKPNVDDQVQPLSPEPTPRQPTRNNWKGPSNMSLSISSSQESVDYNTADETPPGVLHQKSGGNSLTGSHLNCNSNGSSTATICKALNAQPKEILGGQRQTQHDQVVAKLFVICCTCKFWHDMPSEVYAKLAFSSYTAADSAADQKVFNSSKLPKHSLHSQLTHSDAHKEQNTVRCCWCDHHMSKSCCQGWTTIVHLRERHH